MSGTTYSGYYLHETACGLQEEGHEIREEFVELIKEVASRADFSVDYGSAGCGSCFHSEDDAALFWVAQGDATDSLYLKYGSDGYTDELLDLVGEVAEEMDVGYSRPPTSSLSIYLGADDRYDNVDFGARVANDTFRGTRTGTVLNPDLINTDYTYEVYEGAYHDHNMVAEFDDEKDAEMFCRNKKGDYSYRRTMDYAHRPGDNLVLFDGSQKAKTVKTSDLRVIDD